MYEGLMTHQVTIRVRGAESEVNDLTGAIVEAAPTVLYTGKAMIYSAVRSGSAAPAVHGGMPLSHMDYNLDVPISFQADVPVEAVVLVTGVDAAYSGVGSVGTEFIIDSEVLGTIEVSRRFNMHTLGVIPNG